MKNGYDKGEERTKAKLGKEQMVHLHNYFVNKTAIFWQSHYKLFTEEITKNFTAIWDKTEMIREMTLLTINGGI